LTAVLFSLAESGGFRDSDPSAPPPPPTTASDVAKVGLLLTVTQAMGWAGAGFLVGGRQSFDLDGPAK
jgi:hypothetical protein